ncbi:MAG: hypothetical protein GY727_14820 [Gammaproteobacteria bacterium]|nr:hypothetical protein [Gammaproteobacteria bacterium]
MNITGLKTEIDTDPLTRGYVAMTDLQVADDMNLVNREAYGGIDGMLKYVVENMYRTNDSGDTTKTSILGRLVAVSESMVGADPFDSGHILTLSHIHAAKMFMYILNNTNVSTLDFVNTEVDGMVVSLNGAANNAGVWSIPDGNALKALSQNQQSRAQELGFGKIREGNVWEARQ